MRPFLTEAAHLVAGYGGSLSGEHGDGRARSELLPIMYSRQAIEAFGAFKALFDPDGLLNPGVLVRTRAGGWGPAAGRGPPAAGRRRVLAGRGRRRPVTAAHRCVGMAKCRADNRAAGGFMCPSYLATRDEKDSTRGRARVLQELANGSLITGGWRAPEVHQALDLCLSCKACSRDCPVWVDMATYKSEVLYRAYRRRLRPRSHYALGWLPRWIRLAAAAPGLANAALGCRRSLRPRARRRDGPAPVPLPAFARRARSARTVPASAVAAASVPRPAGGDLDGHVPRAFAPPWPSRPSRCSPRPGYAVTVPDDHRAAASPGSPPASSTGPGRGCARPSACSRRLRGTRDHDRRPRAVLHRRAPLRPHRAAGRRPAGPGRRARHPDPRRELLMGDDRTWLPRSAAGRRTSSPSRTATTTR